MVKESASFSSNEQDEIVRLVVEEKRNLIVNGYAGFGKTTTALRIAQKILEKEPDKKILILTYNKELQRETGGKLSTKINNPNVKCLTFHAYLGEQYSTLFKGTINGQKSFSDDQVMINALILILERIVRNTINGNKRTVIELISKLQDQHDLVILDEMQDCTLLLMIYLKKILLQEQQILVMGDQHQTIYEYNGADNRFFRFINFFLNQDFLCVFANKSMRIQKLQANLINYCIAHGQNLPRILDNQEWNLPRKKIQTVKQQQNNEKPTLTYLANFSPNLKRNNLEKKVYQANWQFIADWINEKKQIYSANEIAILLTNIQDDNLNIKSFLKPLLDTLGFEYGKSDHLSSADEQKNRIIISTYHQFKGRERKCIILFNFSNESFSQETILKENKINELSDMFYVGITRAKTHLLICENVIWHKTMLANKVQNRFNFLPESFPEDCQKLGIEYHDFYSGLLQKAVHPENYWTEEFDYPGATRNPLMPGKLPKTTLTIQPSNVAKNIDYITMDRIAKILEKHNLLKKIHLNKKIDWEYIKMNTVTTPIEIESVQSSEDAVLVENVSRINSAFILNEYWLKKGRKVYSSIWNQIKQEIPVIKEVLKDKKQLHLYKMLSDSFAALESELNIWQQLTNNTEIDDHQLNRELKLRIITFQMAIEENNYATLRIVNDYTWLDNINLDLFIERLADFMQQFPEEYTFEEVPIELKLTSKQTAELQKFNDLFQLEGITKVKISGRMDFFVSDRWEHNPARRENAIIELKFINEGQMSLAYILQLLIYMLLYNLAYKDQISDCDPVVGNNELFDYQKKRLDYGILYNVKTDEQIMVRNDPEVIRQIFSILFQAKLTEDERFQYPDDDTFIQTVQTILNDDQKCLDFLNNLIDSDAK